MDQTKPDVHLCIYMLLHKASIYQNCNHVKMQVCKFRKSSPRSKIYLDLHETFFCFHRLDWEFNINICNIPSWNICGEQGHSWEIIFGDICWHPVLCGDTPMLHRGIPGDEQCFDLLLSLQGDQQK